jgi:hypothetical protein
MIPVFAEQLFVSLHNLSGTVIKTVAFLECPSIPFRAETGAALFEDMTGFRFCSVGVKVFEATHNIKRHIKQVFIGSDLRVFQFCSFSRKRNSASAEVQRETLTAEEI